MSVLVFGDSITQGFHDSEGGWVDRLKRDLLKAYKGIFFANLGISGDKVNDVLARFENETEARLKEWDETFDQNIIIIAIGQTIHNTKGDSSEPVTPKLKFVKRFESLLERAQAKAKYVLVCSILPCDEQKSAPTSWKDISYLNSKIDEYNKEIQKLCQNKKSSYVDINTEAKKSNWNKMLDDGVHPNSAGHEWICEQVKLHLIICIGASSLYGVGGTKGSWADLYKQNLHLKQYGDNGGGQVHEIYNLGIPGATIENFLKRVEIDLISTRKPGRKLVTVIQIGGNNTMAIDEPENYTTSPEKFKHLVKVILQIAKKYSDELLWVGLNLMDERKVMPIEKDLEKNRKVYFPNERRIAFDKIAQETCRELNVKHINLIEEQQKMNWM
jgi:lysophospholipase L1-like esterase